MFQQGKLPTSVNKDMLVLGEVSEILWTIETGLLCTRDIDISPMMAEEKIPLPNM